MNAGLVTIGVPTYNRVNLLRRALASARAQDYPAIEILISDNASSDGTARTCQELVEADPRVRYLRQDHNIGGTANFRAVLDAARGEYFMWLADDDVLAANYVSECVKALEHDHSTVLAAGRPYMTGDGMRFADAAIHLVADEGSARVLGYYGAVTRNSVFSGVARTAFLKSRPPLRNVTGGDWLFTASVAFGGRIRTLESTTLECSSGGVSDDLRRAARTLGMTRLAQILPRVALSANVGSDLLVSPTYRTLGAWRRLDLAVRCALLAGWRVGVRYHAIRMLRSLVSHVGVGRHERPGPVPIRSEPSAHLRSGDPDSRMVPTQALRGLGHEPV